MRPARARRGVSRRASGLALALSLALSFAFALAPRAARADDPALAVAVAPTSLRLGVDRVARVELVAPDVDPARLELVASVGAVGPLVRTAPGHFLATYAPPASRAPDVVVLVARLRGTAAASVATLPLEGRYRLTVAVEPAARVAVQVGAQPEHVAVAPAIGAVELEVHVPPGVDRARIVATDRAGNRTEHAEALDGPPLHRALFLPAPPPPGAPSALRWLVAFASPDGAPSVAPPALEVSGARHELRARGPGLFELVVRPPRRLAPSAVTVTVREPQTAQVPDAVGAEVPAAVLARAEIAPGAAARAGEPFLLPFAVRDQDGALVVGLEDAIVARVGTDASARVEPRGEGYAVLGRAPRRAGVVEVAVRAAPVGASAIESRGALTVSAADAVRFAPPLPVLARGVEQTVTLRAIDRFGNPAPVGHPTLRIAGASRAQVEPDRAGVRLRFVPERAAVRVAVRGDDDFADAVELPARGLSSQSLVMGLEVLARQNLGALWLGGLRLRLEARAPLARGRLSVTGGLWMGAELGSSSDGEHHTATVETVPVFARGGLLVNVGRAAIGLIGGFGGRMAAAQLSNEGRTGAAQVQWSWGLTGAGLFELRTELGVFFLEAGAESGALDTVAARGTLGGIYGALGWGVGL